jgi:outer membrane protein OmpA-like peptidoglycan-associated protein
MVPWLLVAATGFAQDPLTFSTRATVPVGQVAPAVLFHAHADGQLEAHAACAGRSARLTTALAPGQTYELLLPDLGEGEHACEVDIALTLSDGSEGRMTLPVTVRALPPLSLAASRADLDLAAGTLVVHGNRPLATAALTVRGEAGVIATAEGSVAGADASFRWDAAAGDAVRLDIEAADPAGLRSRLELTPWSYAIPHTDVRFASGGAEVPAEDVPWLEASWAEVVAVTARFGALVPIKLYVAGFTDTVGEAASNLALSRRRAAALAAWFRARGFEGPVYWQGFGERGLLVPTADGVDEPANRRAVYILAAEAPPASDTLPGEAWELLR